MFKLHVGDTPCELSQADYRTLAEGTDGFVPTTITSLDVNSSYTLTFFYSYSGSDISIVVRDALMQPVRKVLSATHFKQVHCPTDDDPNKIKWTPCSPGDPEGVEKTWTDIEGDELLEPQLRVGD